MLFAWETSSIAKLNHHLIKA